MLIINNKYIDLLLITPKNYAPAIKNLNDTYDTYDIYDTYDNLSFPE